MQPVQQGDLERDSRGIINPGRMLEHVEFRRTPPPADLSGVVEWFWAVQWAVPDGEEFVQSVLSHPTANISVGPVSSRGIDSDAIEATAVGVVTRVDHRRLRGTGWNVAAKLRPGALGALLTGSAAQLTDRIVPVGEVLPVDAGRLVAAMCGRAGEVGQQVDELAAVLRGVLQRADPDRMRMSAVAVRLGSLIEHDRSIRTVRALSELSGYGARSLQRIFAAHAGVAPLWMIRRYRLIDAADAARSGRPPAWSVLAGELGYADQAHLTRDFKATLGVTPAAYAASVQPLPGPGDARRGHPV